MLERNRLLAAQALALRIFFFHLCSLGIPMLMLVWTAHLGHKRIHESLLAYSLMWLLCDQSLTEAHLQSRVLWCSLIMSMITYKWPTSCKFAPQAQAPTGFGAGADSNWAELLRWGSIGCAVLNGSTSKTGQNGFKPLYNEHSFSRGRKMVGMKISFKAHPTPSSHHLDLAEDHLCESVRRDTMWPGTSTVNPIEHCENKVPQVRKNLQTNLQVMGGPQNWTIQCKDTI